MRSLTATCLLAGCLGLLACKDSGKGAPAKAAAGASNSSDEAATVAQPIFEIDGKAIEVPRLGDDVELLSLKALPPIDDWKSLVVRSVDGREFQGSKPRLLTGVRTMKLVKLPAGYEFRVMDLNDSGPYVRHKMNTVARVVIFTKDYKAPDVAPPSLRLESPGGETIVVSDLLDSLERVPEPGEEEARDTWPLATIIGQLARRDALETVVLSNARGETMALSSAELNDAGWSHFVKRNRRGEFNYRGWKLGDTPAKERELRGLATIELR